MKLAELARKLDLELRGDSNQEINHVCQLEAGDIQGLSFLGDRKLRDALPNTLAGCVILKQEDADAAPCSVLLSNNPYLDYARAAQLLHPLPAWRPGCHPSAVIDSTAQIDPSAYVGPLTVIEAGVIIGPRTFIGPSCVISQDTEIGADCRLVARVTLCHRVRLGNHVLIHPGAVIGREGFGFARDGERWVRMPQIGRVILEDEVEIGANTTVDRGAIADTILHRGVKLDNQIQIGHNAEIGENTAMASNTGISGSTRIGRNCTIAGAVGMAGHLEIGDNVHFTGMAMVTHSIRQPGIYSSGLPAMPNREWLKNTARFRRLVQLDQRLRQVEAQLQETMPKSKGTQSNDE